MQNITNKVWRRPRLRELSDSLKLKIFWDMETPIGILVDNQVGGPLAREIQRILNLDRPVTFLYKASQHYDPNSS